MITNTVTSFNKSGGIDPTNRISHSISEQNKAIIFNILRKQLYSDPQLACIREISANSVDAHVAQSKLATPIQVTLPTNLDSFFKVRDFGCGLSDEDIKNLYAAYGDSGKRHTNDQIGGFGIGKHAPLAYTDSFTIQSYQNGVVNIWNSFVDVTQCGQIAKMGSAPTNEPDGIEIVVPVKNADIDSFHQKAIDLFAYFRTTPTLVNATQYDMQRLTSVKSAVPILEGQGYKYIGNRSSKVLMGDIPYSIKSSDFTEDDLDETARIIVNEGVVLTFNIGELEVSASRETLNYSPATKKKLAAVLNSITKDLLAKSNDKFKNCQTLWEAKCLYRTAFSSDGGLYNLRRYLENNVTFNGQKLNGTHFDNSTNTKAGEVSIAVFASNSYYNKRIKRVYGRYIDANERYTVIENDLGISNGIINRIVGLLELPYANRHTGQTTPYDHVYLISFKDAAVKAQWLKDTGYDGPMDLLSLRPKELLTTYYGSTAQGISAAKNAKHATKEFTLDRKHQGGYQSKNSDYFSTCTVDVEQDAGVYVLIDGFYCESKANDGYYGLSPSSLIDTLNELEKHFGVKMPTIYAFKRKHADKVRKNKTMVNVWTWINEQVTTFFADVNEQTKFANWMAIKSARHQCAGIEYFASLKSLKVDPKSDLTVFLDMMSVLFKKDGMTSDIEVRKKFTDQLGMGDETAKYKATINVIAEYKKTHAKYPLLFAVVRHCGYDSRELKAEVKSLEDYVEMVDAKAAATLAAQPTPVTLPVTASNGAI